MVRFLQGLLRAPREGLLEWPSRTRPGLPSTLAVHPTSLSHPPPSPTSSREAYSSLRSSGGSRTGFWHKYCSWHPYSLQQLCVIGAMVALLGLPFLALLQGLHVYKGSPEEGRSVHLLRCSAWVPIPKWLWTAPCVYHNRVQTADAVWNSVEVEELPKEEDALMLLNPVVNLEALRTLEGLPPLEEVSPLEGLKVPPAKDEAEDAGTQSPSPGERRHGALEARLRLMLQRHVAFPGSEVCGAWSDDYINLQRDIRSGAPGVPQKYLTFGIVPGGPGVGDSLTGVISAFLVALLTRRAFIVAHPTLSAAFVPSEVDWHVRGDVPMEVNAHHLSEIQEGSVVHMVSKNGDKGAWPQCPTCDGMVWDILRHFNGTGPASNIVLAVHHSILVEVFSHLESHTSRALQAMGMRLHNAHACILRMLFRPSEAVVAGMLRPMAALHKPGTQSICIHARTIDSLLKGQGSEEMVSRALNLLHVQNQCAEEVEAYWVPDGVKATWFLMSDSSLIKNKAREEHPDKLVMTTVKPMHTGEGCSLCWVTTVIEWYLFSMCDYYVITESGLSKLAYVYNLKRPPLYFFNRIDAGETNQKCTPAIPVTLAELGGWSGL